MSRNPSPSTVEDGPSASLDAAAPEIEIGLDDDSIVVETESLAPRNPRNRALWVLAAIVAVGAFLRVYGLNRFGFNSDEAVYAGQGASIAGTKGFLAYFPIYRAHPLMYQMILSLVYQVHVSDFVARMVSVVFGLGTIIATYALGTMHYRRRVGLIAAALVAVMPYHVIVSRQALLDGPEVFFATLALLALTKYRLTQRVVWLYALAGGLGLTFLSKETGAILLVSVFAYLALDADFKVPLRNLAVAGAIFVGMAITYPLAIAGGGASKNGKSFFVWQLLRASNHGISFYARESLPAIGYTVVAIAIIGLWKLRSQRTWRETMLLAWVLVPTVFFGIWPVKGYQYLLLIVPPVAVLAARALAAIPTRGEWDLGRLHVAKTTVLAIIGVVVGASLLIPTWSAITTKSPDSFLAGTGGLPGGREAGEWINDNIPRDAQLLAIGPSMANVVQFYSQRKTWGLSVSNNAQDRNPVYEPLKNPNLTLRDGSIQFVVWDAYSADRSSSSSKRLLGLVEKFHGRLIFQHGPDDNPSIRIYEVRP